MDGIKGDEKAILGSIGRKRFSFALTDRAGLLRQETIRTYDAQAATGVSAALTCYQRDLELPFLLPRAAFAVAGLVRGDAISITSTRCFLSRSGLKAMLGRPPLILNDFAAEAWAFFDESVRPVETFSPIAWPASHQPGCFTVIGITSGLGVSVVNRSERGERTVLPTEAGHGAFAAATEELAQLSAELFPGHYPVTAEDIVSAPGLVAIYKLLARQAKTVCRLNTPEEVTRAAATDPTARNACILLAKAFWAQAGSLVTTFGAWDGMVLTGGLANAIRQYLRAPEAQALFAASSKHHRVLERVPRAFVSLDHGELFGAAEALRSYNPT